jgi:hypothetical protein
MEQLPTALRGRIIRESIRKGGKNTVAEESNVSLLQALEGGTKSETKMRALCLMLEFRSAEEKLQAMQEVK